MPTPMTTRLFESFEPRLLMASISGTVFSDLDGNGLRGAGEPELADWAVFLDRNRDHVLGAAEPTTVTNAAGEYTFNNIVAGNYSLTQVVPLGWAQTYPNAGDALAGVGIVQSPLRSDVIQTAIARLSDLDAYSPLQLRGATTWVVGMDEGNSVDPLARALAARSVSRSALLPDTYILSFDSKRNGSVVATSLGAQRDVSFFYPQIASQKGLRFIPTDPLFAQQWHLRNTGQIAGGLIGEDVRAVSAWDSYLGNGVTIGIVDDGLQYTHPDLSANYIPSLSYDYFDNDSNPAPGTYDWHGTSVAGVAAARGSNGIGVSGSAPLASLAGLRLVVGATTDAQEANALSHLRNDIDIYSNSWGPYDDGVRLEGPGPLTLAAFQTGTTGGRNGLGNIFVWAAGNGLTDKDNVNYDGYANSRYVVAVSAIDAAGEQSWYSEPGAPIFVAAHSSGDAEGITTTDRTGSNGYSATDYANDFGGTSSAAPLAAGVVALMLQANPNLTWRDVQHILAHTARQNDPSDSDWTLNGAGLHVNHKYGFGAIDAAAATTMAAGWNTVAPESLVTSGTLAVGTTIPDNNTTGVTRSFDVTSALRIETVEVVFNATHTYRGDLRIVLTSPSGTESVLAEVHDDFGDNMNWTFTSRRHWDELAAGTWSLKVTDGVGTDVGVWNSWRLNLYGTAPDASTHYVVLNSADALTGLSFGAHDTAAPTVASSIFDHLTSQRITLQFSEDVSGSLSVADLVLEDLTHGTTVSPLSLNYDSGTQTATFTYPAGLLPDANYRATLVAGGVSDASGNAMASDQVLEFFVLGGDANRDRAVDITDLGILATNWQQSPRDFSQGDFNYDGVVDITDLGILATNWQQNVPAPSALGSLFADSGSSGSRLARAIDQIDLS